MDSWGIKFNSMEFQPKLRPLYAAMLPLMVFSMVNDASAAACSGAAADGVSAEISGANNCGTAAGNQPTTVTFQTGSTGRLDIFTAAPTGAVTNQTDGEGIVQIQASTVTSNADFGVTGSKNLKSLLVEDAATFNLGHDLAALTVTVGQGATGILNQSAGTVTATTLAIAANGTFTQSGTGVINATNTTIATGGTLTLVGQGTGTIQGAASGQGALVFAGSYITDAVLGGTSLASITINDGQTLTLNKNASATTITVGTGTTGVVNQSAGTLAATTLEIAAGGTFNQSGTGVVNTTNTTIATGGTLTLVGQGTGAIKGAAAGQGALVFSGNYNTDAALGGTSLASITVNSGKTLTLDQAASATAITIAGVLAKSSANGMTGITTINNGGSMTVAANFTHTGALTVGQGASGSLSVAGNTVNVTGQFDLKAGATFKTTINSATADDAGQIISTSTANNVAAGTTIDIDTGAVSLVAGTTYNIINGDGTGTVLVPTTIIDNNANFNFIGSVVSGDFILTVQSAALISSTTGLSSNATAVVTAVENFSTSDTTLANAITGLSGTTETSTALESLVPDMSGAAQNATFAAHDFSIGTIVKRLLSLRTSGGGMMTGVAAGDPYRQHEIGMWIQGFGSTIDQDNRQGISGFDADTVGAAFGADTLLTKNFRIGASFSYASTDVDTKGSANSTNINSYQGALYTSYEWDEYYFDGIASYALNDYDAARNVVVGAVNRIAGSDYEADQYGIKGTVGRTMHYSNFDLSPYVSLDYVRLNTDSYTETGAGAANLVVNAEETDVLQSTLGVSISKEMETRKGMRFIPEAHVAWLHEYLDEGQINTSAFTSGGGSFSTTGFDPANDSINTGASVAIYKTESLDIRAAYDFEAKENYDGHSGQLTLRYTFY